MSSPLLSQSQVPPTASPTDVADSSTVINTAFKSGNVLSTIAPLAAAFALLCVLAWPMLTWWHWEYTKPESYYQHAFAIPFLAAVMFWHRRQTLAEIEKKTNPAALLVLITSLALLVIAAKTEMQAVMSFTFLTTLVSSVWFVAGTRFVKAAAFPLGFLWLMAPLPGPVLNDATLNLQSLSTGGAAKILQLMALHPVREGNLIHIDDFTLNVDVPCSGFKLLLLLLTFNLAFANLTDTTLARRISLFLISIPLSLVSNAIRIALVGVAGVCFGSSAAHTFHDWSGILSLVFCMAALFGAAKVMGCRTFAGQPIF